MLNCVIPYFLTDEAHVSLSSSARDELEGSQMKSVKRIKTRTAHTQLVFFVVFVCEIVAKEIRTRPFPFSS